MCLEGKGSKCHKVPGVSDKSMWCQYFKIGNRQQCNIFRCNKIQLSSSCAWNYNYITRVMNLRRLIDQETGLTLSKDKI